MFLFSLAGLLEETGRHEDEHNYCRVLGRQQQRTSPYNTQCATALDGDLAWHNTALSKPGACKDTGKY